LKRIGLVLMIPAVMGAWFLFAESRQPVEFRMVVGNSPLSVELAVTPEERARGLMYRESLADDRGMLFVFEYSGRWGFWMKNTLIPLSIAFLDHEGNVVNIEDMQPHDTTVTMPKGEILYALEVNLGWFARHGIRPGSRIALPEQVTKIVGNQR